MYLYNTQTTILLLILFFSLHSRPPHLSYNHMYVVVHAGAFLYAMRRASADRQPTAIGIWSSTGTQLAFLERKTIPRVISIHRDTSVREKKYCTRKQTLRINIALMSFPAYPIFSFYAFK